MRPVIIFLVFCLLFISCAENKPLIKPNAFKSLEFSYSDVFSTCFSMKFTPGDTVFIKQHFASAFNDSLKSGQSYFAKLTALQKERLDSFMKSSDFASCDTSYYENYVDGEEYLFFIQKDSIQKTIYVHSDSVPTDLKMFGYWIVKLKRNLRLTPIDTIIKFESAVTFLPPKVSVPDINFTKPRIR